MKYAKLVIPSSQEVCEACYPFKNQRIGHKKHTSTNKRYAPSCKGGDTTKRKAQDNDLLNFARLRLIQIFLVLLKDTKKAVQCLLSSWSFKVVVSLVGFCTYLFLVLRRRDTKLKTLLKQKILTAACYPMRRKEHKLRILH